MGSGGDQCSTLGIIGSCSRKGSCGIAAHIVVVGWISIGSEILQRVSDPWRVISGWEVRGRGDDFYAFICC